jgi:hypothetical protein
VVHLSLLGVSGHPFLPNPIRPIGFRSVSSGSQNGFVEPEQRYQLPLPVLGASAADLQQI